MRGRNGGTRSVMRTSLLALAALAVAAISADGRAQSSDGRTILAFGDSLTAGYGLDEGLGFAPQLEDALRRQGLAVTVKDGGVSGDTTSAGLARLEWVLDGLEKKPDLVILELGANDMLRVIDPKVMDTNLRAMMEIFRERDIRVLVAGMKAAPNYDPAYIAAYDAVHPKVAADYGAPLYPLFVDGVAGDPALLQPDGLHPEFEGIKVIVSRILPAVEKALAGGAG